MEQVVGDLAGGDPGGADEQGGQEAQGQQDGCDQEDGRAACDHASTPLRHCLRTGATTALRTPIGIYSPHTRSTKVNLT